MSISPITPEKGKNIWRKHTIHIQYMEMARSLFGYSRLEFPACSCSSRKEGRVILSVAFDNILMRAEHCEVCEEDNVEL